ncbi:MAG TPA: MFS transporter, partial [Acidimicrobiales bacterium]|nr:MFS transporter [Acidimicrobiales bacterium]
MVLSTLRRAGHFPSLVAAFVYFDVSFMVWMLLGALGPYVAADLDLSAAQKGLMVAAPLLGGAAFRLLLGGLADRLGCCRVGMSALGLTAGGSYWQVLGMGALLGIAGASFTVALPLASGWYPPEHQGLALGVVGAGNSGTLIAALAGPRLAEHVGWHGVFAIALIPLGLAFLVFTALAREPRRRGTPSRPLALVGDPEAQRLAGLYAVTFGGFVGLVAYLPIY